MLAPVSRASNEAGFTLLEVLITMIVLAVGLLGLASLQSKAQVVQVDSYQRSQAVMLLNDMVNRIDANRANAASYITTADTPAYLGTGDSVSATCTGSPSATRDRCEWSNALKGAAETTSASASVGAMVGARGCVERLVTPDPTAGVCTPGAYRVTVVWQGLNETAAPSQSCGQTLYGSEGLRRAVSTRIVIGLNTC